MSVVCCWLRAYTKLIVTCSHNEVQTWCIMPKRSMQNSFRNKKIRLAKNLIDHCISTSSKTSQHNLHTAKKMDKMSSNVNDVKKVRDIKVEYLDTPIKSESDKKEYRVIKLENGLVALLISDIESIGKDRNDENKEATPISSSGDESENDSEEETDDDDCSEEEESDEDHESQEDDEIRSKSAKKEEKMAACGLCVGVGSFSDPPEIPGMAHFLEHMVFMGSERYPQENDFENFIKRRGGSDNASTDCEQTTFYFEIQEKHLFPAMERFAQFFISPLMKRDTITREREAIESEFKMALPSDSNRKDQLFCGLARKNHPATKFSWGNLITLRDNVDEDDLYSKLHQFRERHYSAHRMTLAVQARLPLDELEQYVRDCFSEVPVNHLPADDFTEFIGKDSFDNPEFRKLFKVKPIKDVCQIELTWVMPPLHHLYKKKPHQYISWIIGHEGEGSLIDYLRKKMWCLEIFSGNGEGGFEHSSMYALFSLSLTLTDEGHKHLKEVLEAVFSYINMLRREGPQKRIFDEIQKIEEITFRFSDEEDPVDYVEALCGNMHFYPPSDYITGSDLYFEYDPESIKSCIDALTPNNVNIILFDRKFNEDEFDKVEPWFQTKYSSEEIPTEWVKCWETIEPLPEFHLPKPNMFITDDFKLIDLPDNVPNYPVKIHQDDKMEIWHRVDPKFRLPESYMYFHLITPAAIESPKTSSMLSIFIALLKQLSIGSLYDASAAELNYQFYPSDKGMIIQVFGFNQKLPLLLSSVLKYVADCSDLMHEELFDVIKKEVTKSYYNTFLKPAKLTKEVRLSIITKGFWTSIERHAVVSDVTFEEFKVFAKHLTDKVYIQCLVQGNVTQKDALEQVIQCIEPLKNGILPKDARPEIKVLEVPLGERCCQVKNFNPTDCNSVVTNYYQSGVASIKLSVIIELIMMIIEEPLFNQLRTIEQLGYNVFCLLRDTFGILGYSITVCTQANKFSTEHVDTRIESFVQDMIAVLNEMPPEEYDFYKESLIKVKRCTDSYLREEVNRNWSEIVREEYIFDRYEKEITEINKIAVDALRQWLCDHSLNGKNFRKLTVQVVGVADSSEESTKDEEQNSDMKKYQVEFMTGANIAEKPSNYYIIDVAEFKGNLPQYCSSQKYTT